MLGMKRRSFLKTSGVAAAATALPPISSNASAHTPEEKYRADIPELFEAVPRPPAYTPALVIGSGFGGAISAYRLAQAGIENTVLERGCRWPQDPKRDIHSSDFAPDGRAFWHRTDITHITGLSFDFDKFGGILDVTDYEHISVWRGACVGGGSKVFTGVMIQPEREYFEEIFQDNVDFDEMNDTYYPRVKEMLRLSPLPNDLYWKSGWGHSRVWDSNARAAGYTPEPIDGIWNWDVVRKESYWWRGNRRSATVGESNHGNANGAKFDVTQNYLKYAEESGYTTVYSGTQVKGISQEANGNYLVQVEQIDPMGEVVDEYTLSCGSLFMAAGSIGTTELLLRARERGDLPNLNEHIGEGWGTNGDAAAARTLAPSLGVYQASPSASKIHDTSFGLPVTMENWYAFVSEVGNSFLEAYVPIVEKRKALTYTETQRNWQEIRRGRYVEFNLVHDKGTLFGLKTNGRIESILMSLPPHVQWQYDHHPEKGSEEEKLIDVLTHPKNWI